MSRRSFVVILVLSILIGLLCAISAWIYSGPLEVGLGLLGIVGVLLTLLITLLLVLISTLINERRDLAIAVGLILSGLLIGLGLIIGPFIGRVVSVTPPTKTPVTTPTPLAKLATHIVTSEVQPDGTIKNTSKLVVNDSLGVGTVVLTYPTEMNINDSKIMTLSITPEGAVPGLSTDVAPTPNSGLPTPFEFTQRIEIYSRMEAELIAEGFDYAPRGKTLKLVLSDGTTEWRWSLKPKQTGAHDIVVEITIPVSVDGVDTPLSTDIADPFEGQITVRATWPTRIENLSGDIIVGGFGVVAAIVAGLFAVYLANRSRENHIRELESRIAQDARDREDLREQIRSLRSTPWWKIWRR